LKVTSLMPNFLRIMEWNASGLLQHKEELQAILSTENIDICLISETHSTSESHVQFRICVIYHTIHPANTARGGSSVMIRDTIKHYEVEKCSTRNIQATSVTIVTTKQTHCKCNILSLALQYLHRSVLRTLPEIKW
jgi:hypothetical protein